MPPCQMTLHKRPSLIAITLTKVGRDLLRSYAFPRAALRITH